MTLLPPINHCKICFKEIKISDFCRFFDRKTCICQSCQRQIAPKFISFDVDGYKAIAIYEYSEFIKNLIYLYKGCSDYEMKDVFLNLFIKELRIRYKDYKIIPIPSYKEDDEARGFNHVNEVFKLFKQDMLYVLSKTQHFKQASKGAKKRKEIHKYLKLNQKIFQNHSYFHLREFEFLHQEYQILLAIFFVPVFYRKYCV